MKISERFIYNYAAALMNIATEDDKIKHYLAASNLIVEVLKKYPIYIKIMSNVDIPKQERKDVLKETFGKTIDVKILHALYLLIDREAFSVVRPIFKQLRKLINLKNDVRYGKVFSALPLSDQQIEVIEAKISQKFGYHIELVNKIDKKIIAGIKIKVKDEIIDGSIAGQLEAMRSKALNNK
ncbi:F0F1 ATP synthase subunit delta [Spiroplasma syrphidicola EA-1]|uniref:ATP synthase subunit delta n=1 Tax=Spiroplasma syrphidicola EA-1 TaxID=1276229 RepID=R4U569_9MOLU|nr:F0F1 ATP synthase subunit delta [Spiroplasma syrphidicola]AGM25703.1 F0F1 ATP synthase subunit delta [Spiroplasma syrphidicola EA-1]